MVDKFCVKLMFLLVFSSLHTIVGFPLYSDRNFNYERDHDEDSNGCIYGDDRFAFVRNNIVSPMKKAASGFMPSLGLPPKKPNQKKVHHNRSESSIYN